MSYDTDRYLFYHTQTSALSLTECGIQICHPAHAVPPLKYPDYSFHFILEGKGVYEIGGERYTLSAGEGFLIKPGDICAYTADEREPWKYVYVSFRGTEADAFAKKAGLAQKCVFSFPCTDEMKKQIYAMHAAGKADLHQGMDALGYFLLVTSCLLARLPREHTQKNAEQQHLLRAKRYIEYNYAYRIRVQDIASHACLERSYLYRLFMRYEKQSPLAYLCRVRLLRAAALLLESALSVAEIAERVGFFDASHFSKAFLKEYGRTPGEYRKKNG